MIELTKVQEDEILKIMIRDCDAAGNAGLYLMWDYLETEGYPAHLISEYINQNGELLVNKSLLGKVIGL